jgi:ABC-type uncharacterized transport system ATPase subunit
MAGDEPTGEPSDEPSDELTDEQRAMLEFERDWPVKKAGKGEAIRVQFAMSLARYYQVLGSVIVTEEALKFDPLLVKRLLRQQEDRRRSRNARITPTKRS